MAFPASIWPLLKPLTFIAGFCAALSSLCTLLTANHLEVGKDYCRGKGPFSKPPFVFSFLSPPHPANTLCSLPCLSFSATQITKKWQLQVRSCKTSRHQFLLCLEEEYHRLRVRPHLWDNDPFIGLRVLLLNYSKHTTSEGWDPPWGNFSGSGGLLETSSFLEEIEIDINESLADIQLSKRCPILLLESLAPTHMPGWSLISCFRCV